MYRITFVLDLFKGPEEQEVSHQALRTLLMALMYVDIAWLQANPKAPLLYESGVRYEEEPPGQEDWQDIPTTLRMKVGDCVPVDSLVLRSDYTLVAIGDVVPGDVIMGDGVWTKVLDTAVTGEKSILGFDLDNGSTLRCSPEHRVFLQDGTEVRAKDVKVGDRLKSPTSIPMSSEAWTPDERLSSADTAWLVGTYVADGWHEKSGSRFCISGDDENPKRGKLEQKKRVLDMMEAAGIQASRAKKYVSVQDRSLTSTMIEAGSHAPKKRVPTMALTEVQVRDMLEGLRTDASLSTSGTYTHGTVSPVLAEQLRVLYRMLGQSVHIRRWDEHGGLGENPIYRVTVRDHAEPEAPKNWQTRAKNNSDSAKVKGIRELEPALCCDITTDSGRFYLPESDVVVHNCEDLACWRAAELRVRYGIAAIPIFTCKPRANGGYLYHITVQLPDGRIEDPSRRLGMR